MMTMPSKTFLPINILILLICLATGRGSLLAADTAVVTNGNTAESTGDTLRTYLQLQEQLHATQLAIERNRDDAEKAAARNAEAMTERLASIEKTLTSQRAQELEAMRSANKFILIAAGTFAGIGLLAMLLAAYMQWNAANRLAAVTASFPTAAALGFGGTAKALGQGGTEVVVADGIDQSSARFLSAIEKLEKRILELEQTAGAAVALPSPENGAMAHSEESNGTVAEITLLIGKGETLLKLDKFDEAIACFDHVLDLDSNNTDALVKKGTALERLERLNEAVDCYDRAIAADSSITMAYLYKGGVYNRMERYSEALECYEQALRTQDQVG